MCRIIVSVSFGDDPSVTDLEIPANCPSEQLGNLLVSALNPQEQEITGQSYRIEVVPLGRTLLDFESLSDVGCWDGTHLIVRLYSADNISHTFRESHRETKGLVDEMEWEPFSDMTNQNESPPDDDTNASESDGYVWKELD